VAVTAHDTNRERHWTCARRLCERRHDLGLTQNDVVERLTAQGAVATNRTLSAMEHGQGVDVGRLPELAVALDCTITYLLGLTEEPGQWAPDVDRHPSAGDRTEEPEDPTRLDRVANGVVDVAHVSWILGPDIPERRNSGANSMPTLQPDQRHA
jgi:transcriptional regulator with XRE-family HTH domain